MAAVALVIKGAVVSPARFLRRSVRSHIVHYRLEIDEKDFKRLDGPIQVLVVDGVLIVPDSGVRAGYFIANEENTVVARIGLEHVADRCACPGHDGGLHSHGRAKR